MSEGTFFAALERLVEGGDYGNKAYNIPLIKKKMERGRDRYLPGPFSWETVLSTDAPALHCKGACNDVAGVKGYARMPQDPAHLLMDLKAGSIVEVVRNGVKEAKEAGIYTQPDQLAVELPSYFSKLKFPRDQAYVWKPEYWLQDGNRESAIHVDHGRVVAYIPPCARHCFKVWVFFPKESSKKTAFKYDYKDDSINRMLRTANSGVLAQRPGDVVCLNNLVFHAFLLVYKPGTAPEDRWGGVFGDVVVCATDRVESFRYATKVASGVKKGSKHAWETLLSAYSTIEDGYYDPNKYDEVLKKFLDKLELDDKSEKARVGATAKKEKKRKKLEKMEKVRTAKRGNHN